jgi:FtsP/CotA-like multicopper oxidase with cupredoxin domain
MQRFAVLALLALADDVRAERRDFVLRLTDELVNHKRPHPCPDLPEPANWVPGHCTQEPCDRVPIEDRHAAQLVNGCYPGTTIDVMEGDEVHVTVVNELYQGGAASMHWHGLHMKMPGRPGTPWDDGPAMVTQCSIAPWENYTYTFDAYPAGTHWYHSHLGITSAKGVMGALIVRAKDDPHADLYDEEQIVTLQDMWQIPEFGMFGGSQFANYRDREIERGMWNGVWGDGSDEYPYPLIKVKPDTRYRLRFINMATTAQLFNISLAGHTFDLIALDGYDVEPVEINSFTLLMGERADVILTTKPPEEAGNYLMMANYSLCDADPMNTLEMTHNWKLSQDPNWPIINGEPMPWPSYDGDLIAAPDMGLVDSCRHYAYISYEGHDEIPRDRPVGDPYNGIQAAVPAGTGGGLGAEIPTTAPYLDWLIDSSYDMVKPLVKPNEALSAEEADWEYTMLIGYQQDENGERYFMNNRETSQPWYNPKTPLLHTKGGECGAEDTPVITVPPGVRTVDLIINNLSPTAHVLHLHGTQFRIIGHSDYSADRGNFWYGDPTNTCPVEDQMLADPDNEFMGPPIQNANDLSEDLFPGGIWWGCAYNETKDGPSIDLEEPIEKDMVIVVRRSWVKLRFEVTNPGVWLFHCHVLTHMMDKMEVAFNFLPDEQLPLPDKVDSCGPCEIWNRQEAREALEALETEEENDVVLSQPGLVGVIFGSTLAGGILAVGMLTFLRRSQQAPNLDMQIRPLTETSTFTRLQEADLSSTRSV